jgi:hypothetical protein
MPLTSKGEEIKDAMQKQYGKEKGEQVFYASKNKGTIGGVDAQPGMMTAPSAGGPSGGPRKTPTWPGRVV